MPKDKKKRKPGDGDPATSGLGVQDFSTAGTVQGQSVLDQAAAETTKVTRSGKVIKRK